MNNVVKPKIIIALDFHKQSKLDQFLQHFKDMSLFVKIGTEFLYSFGWAGIKKLQTKQYKIMLDLKLHDTPRTVAASLKIAVKHNIDYVTFHLAGGPKMIKTALEAVKNSNTKLIGVSWLTSLDEQDGRIINQDLNFKISQILISRMKMGYEMGIDCFVASVLDIEFLKRNFQNIQYFCPGITLDKQKNTDQKRVATPHEGKKAQANYIIIGRALTTSMHPLELYKSLVAEMRS